MNNATTLLRACERSGAFLMHFAHGLLLALGVLSVVSLMAALREPQALRGLPLAPIAEAHAALEAADVRNDGSLTGVVEPARRAAVRPPASAAHTLSPALERVRSYVARRYRVSGHALRAPLVRAQRSGEELGIDPLLIVAVMAIESSFNPMAESGMGAQGLMQVIPRFHMDKIGTDADADALFDPVLNVRVGALVIKEGMRRYGSLQRALQYYGGALGDPQARYAKKVLAMQARLAAVAHSA